MTPALVVKPFGPFKEGQMLDVTFVTGKDGQVYACRFLDPGTNHCLTMPASYKENVRLHATNEDSGNSQGR